MSAHPYPGRRSPWRNLRKHPPALAGDYEVRCDQEVLSGMWIIALQAYEPDWPCDQCEWRGLAEKPDE